MKKNIVNYKEITLWSAWSLSPWAEGGGNFIKSYFESIRKMVW